MRRGSQSTFAPDDGQSGRSWYVDEIYIKVDSRWCCVYRAIDCDGSLVDSLLSETHDLKAGQRFVREARAVVGHAPDRVTTDGHDAYPWRDPDDTRPQSHAPPQPVSEQPAGTRPPGIKQRSYPLRGLGSFTAATRLCTAHEKFGTISGPGGRWGEAVSLV